MDKQCNTCINFTPDEDDQTKGMCALHSFAGDLSEEGGEQPELGAETVFRCHSEFGCASHESNESGQSEPPAEPETPAEPLPRASDYLS